MNHPQYSLVARIFLILLPLLFPLYGVGISFPESLAQPTDVPVLPQPASEDRTILDKAKTLFELQEIDEALINLENFIEEGPSPLLLQEAYFLQAAALRMKNEEQQAASTLEQFLEEFPTSLLANDARFMLGELYVSLNEPERALTLYKEALNFASDLNTRQEILRQIRQIETNRDHIVPAIKTALEEMALLGHQERSELKVVIQDLILQQMNETSLAELVETYPTRYPGDLAMIRLIELHTAHGDEVLAERDIRSFLRRFPSHPYAQTAMALMQSFMTKIKINARVIAAILPFSGPMKTYGEDSLNGIRMALDEGKERLGLSSIGLVVKDTASTTTSFSSELSQLLDEFKPIAAIGPLLSRDLQAMAPLADEYEIPIVTPSATLLNVRQFGSYWFSTALTSALQVSGLVRFAVTQLEFGRFCIIHPDTAYGRELSRLYTAEARRYGAEIIALESYNEAETDVAPQILKLKEKDLAQYGLETPEETKSGKERIVYTPGFDAVFLPGQPVHIALIAAQLAFYDINVPLLGSNSWHNTDLFQWAKHGIEGGIFSDGLFLESPDPSVQEFTQRYRDRFHTEPSIFSVQAYDATRLILDTIQHGAQTGTDVRDQLVRRHDLPALSGFSSFGSNGVLNRKIYMIQVSKGQFVQIN